MVWEARWQSSRKALEAGFKVKSVKLFSCVGNGLTADDKQLIVDTTRQIQAEHDQWLYDPNYRTQREAEAAEREQQIQKLIAVAPCADRSC
jgi:hypothetical protein